MKSNYKKIGPYIQLVDIRNRDLSVNLLLGVSIEKKFIPSIANTIGTDFSTYKIVKKGQFAYGPVTSRNGNKVSIALLDEEICIVSSSYLVFEIVDTDFLLPEYLMLLFNNEEFDRYARFNSWGSAREVFSWDELCKTELNIPGIEEQKRIVQRSKLILNRVKQLENIIYSLSQMAQTLFDEQFGKWCFNIENVSTGREVMKLGNLLTNTKNAIKPEDVGDLPYLPIDYIPKKKLTTDVFCPNEEANSSLITFNKGDILIGAMRVYFHRVIISLADGVTRSTCFVLKPFDEKYRYFALLLCNRDETISFASEHSKGTTMPYAVWEDNLDSLLFIKPTEDEINAFNEKVVPIFTSIYAYNSEIKVLKGMQIALLNLVY